MGTTEVDTTELWGAETRKAVENFPVSGQPIPIPLIRWLGRIKAAAARVNAELGLLDADVAERMAADDVHPNDHANMGQSSNDVFPSAVHLAALGEVTHDLLPAMEGLAEALERKGDEFSDHVKSGRTHLMDAVPVTLG